MGKNLFEVRLDETKPKKANPYVIREVDPAIQKQREQLISKQVKKMLRPMDWFGASVIMLLLAALAIALGVKSFVDAEKPNALFGGVALAVGAALLCGSVAFAVRYLRHKKAEKAGENPEKGIFDEEELRENDRLEREAYRSLGVPDDAETMDVFGCYVEKEGKKTHVSPFASEYRVWKDEENRLCFSDAEELIAIPIADIGAVSLRAEPLDFLFWNKEAPAETYGVEELPDEDEFGYRAGSRYVAEIRSEKGDFELWIPPYEIDAFCRLSDQKIAGKGE